MSIQSEINRIKGNVFGAYSAVEEKGGVIPETQSSDKLAAAIKSIPIGVTEEDLQNALSTKQDLLTGAPGQVVGFDAEGAAKAVQSWSNPNLLQNWDFRNPVNHYGKIEYPTAGYTIDRWKKENANGTVTLNDGSVIFSWNRADSSAFAAFTQVLDYKELLGKVCTWSLVASGTGNVKLAASDSSRRSITLTNEPTLYSITAPLVTLPWLQNHSHFRVIADGASSLTGEIEMFAAKLELGSVQTLAHQDEDGNWVLNDPPDYDLQYALCSQYSPITGEWVGSQHSNLNLLDNWYFLDPVNRTGQTEYTQAGYTIDRWKFNGGTLSLMDKGISWTVGNVLFQMSNLFGSLGNSNVTFSYLDADGNFHSISGKINSYIKCGDLSASLNRTSKTFYIRMDIKTIISAMKLELGSQQTLVHQDDEGNWVLNEIPNYGLQYAICSQYSPTTGEWVGFPFSNPNLLDNWYFADPINQRGQTEYTAAGYTIDRWKVGGGTVALSDGKIVAQHLSGSLFVMQQLNQELYTSLSGKTITVSLLLSDGLLSATGIVPDGDDDLEHRVANAAGSGCEICLYKSGTRKDVAWQILLREQNSVSLIAAKLELGPRQTLAHQDADGNWVLNDPPPNKALELAKCQRYFVEFNYLEDSYTVYGTGVARNATTAFIFLPLTVTLRAKPTISFNGNIILTDQISNVTVDTITTERIAANGLLLRCIVSGNLTPNAWYQLGTLNDVTARLSLNCNL